jgi:hypothetical protein
MRSMSGRYQTCRVPASTVASASSSNCRRRSMSMARPSSTTTNRRRSPPKPAADPTRSSTSSARPAASARAHATASTSAAATAAKVRSTIRSSATSKGTSSRSNAVRASTVPAPGDAISASWSGSDPRAGRLSPGAIGRHDGGESRQPGCGQPVHVRRQVAPLGQDAPTDPDDLVHGHGRGAPGAARERWDPALVGQPHVERSFGVHLPGDVAQRQQHPDGPLHQDVLERQPGAVQPLATDTSRAHGGSRRTAQQPSRTGEEHAPVVGVQEVDHPALELGGLEAQQVADVPGDGQEGAVGVEDEEHLTSCAGQRGQLLQIERRLVGDGVGDVASEADEAADLGVVAQVREVVLDPPQVALGGAHPCPVGGRELPGAQPAHGVVHQVAVLLHVEVEVQIAVVPQIGLLAQDRACGRGDPLHLSDIGVHHPHERVRAVAQRRRQHPLALGPMHRGSLPSDTWPAVGGRRTQYGPAVASGR